MQTLLDDTGAAVEPHSPCAAAHRAQGKARPAEERIADAGLTLVSMRGGRCDVHAHARRMQA